MNVLDKSSEEIGLMSRDEQMKYIADTIDYVETQTPDEYDRFIAGLTGKVREILLARLTQ